jgi:hypothetical protein
VLNQKKLPKRPRKSARSVRAGLRALLVARRLLVCGTIVGRIVGRTLGGTLGGTYNISVEAVSRRVRVSSNLDGGR